MKCTECGAAVKVTYEDHVYVESGLPNVLVHGVEFRTCAKCGARERVIPRLAQLLRALAETLAQQRPRLSGPEVRFLRKHLGWSGEDFANTMGVAAETVSRWENEREPMSMTAERLLRLLALRSKPVDEYPNERLAEVGTTKRGGRLELRNSKAGWQAEIAA